MVAIDDSELRELLNLHWSRHRQTSHYRLRAEVSDYLRRIAGLTPDLRPMDQLLQDLTPAHVRTALAKARATTSDITRLARS